MSNLYDIVMVPDPVLKRKAAAVEDMSGALTSQIDRMIDTMYDAPGIGLAAPQVGILNRVFVMDVPDDGWIYSGEHDGAMIIESQYRSGEDEGLDTQSKTPLVMINPEVVQESDKRSVFQEGCLSIPQQYADVVRPASVTVQYIDRNGDKQEQSFEGLPAHCVQHEIDHLDGVLFIDYLSSLKRNMMIKRVSKLVKQNII
jgi:peptide deformylase